MSAAKPNVPWIPINDAPRNVAFIQWKGTDVCMDLHCPDCKHHNHYDGMFCYYVQCKGCGLVFEMNAYVIFRPALPTDIASNYSAQHPKQSES